LTAACWVAFGERIEVRDVDLEHAHCAHINIRDAAGTDKCTHWNFEEYRTALQIDTPLQILYR